MTDSVHALFRDISTLPIITSRHQEIWLGIQIKAVDRAIRLCEGTSVASENPQASKLLILTSYESLLACQMELENACVEIGIQLPKFATWAAELLSVRRNIFALKRSSLRRFVHLLGRAGEPDEQRLISLSYDIAELLCLLPDDMIKHLIQFEQEFGRPPSADELEERLEKISVIKPALRMVKRRAKTARDTLVTGYLRYALRVARSYVDQGLDYLDLAQEGFLGLMKAAKRYDYRTQARFGHYAGNWIWQSIGRALADQGRTIRLPVHQLEQIGKLQAVYKDLLEEKDEHPMIADIVCRIDLLSTEDVETLLSCGNEGTLLPESVATRYDEAAKRVQLWLTYAQPVLSLDLVLPDRVCKDCETLMRDHLIDAEVALRDIIPGWDNSDPETLADEVITRNAVEQVIDQVLGRPRRRRIIHLRFGFEDGVERTLEEIGQEYGLTRERIRQIEAQTIEALRLYMEKHAFSDYLTPTRTQRAYLPCVVLNYLYQEFDCWQEMQFESLARDWSWLDGLIAKLPGGEWHSAHLRDRPTREDQLAAALRALSVPTHYLDITEQLNDSLEGEELDASYVYLLLAKHETSFILLGQGVFSLVEWERERANQSEPVLPFCPGPLPDPSGQNDTFFESVLVARDMLKRGPTADELLHDIFAWATLPLDQPKWIRQSTLSAYYLVGLIPNVFCFDGHNPKLTCTLPAADIHGLRRHCLQRLTNRLVVMPEFWWVLQRYQPARPSSLGEQFADFHPLGLDDTINRLNILTSLGAVQKLTYGRSYGHYRLTSLGEKLANQWKQRPALSLDEEAAQNQDTLSEDDLEFADLAIW